MTLRKIQDLTPPWKPIKKFDPPCSHPEHDPPKYIVLEPGVYEHTCPGCGRKMTFTVQGAYWK